MKLDDESLLTAYLDGELEPSRRLTVEAALLSSPRLAARLRDLTRVRDAVGGLSRPPAPEDLASAVRSRIEEAEALRRRRLAGRRLALRRLLYLAPASAIAAGLLVAWSVQGLRHADPDPEPGRTGPSTAHAVPAPATEVIREADRVADTPTGPAEPGPAVEASTTPGPALATAEPDAAREGEILVNQDRFLRLLGRMKARRMLLLVDSLDDDRLGRVESAIDETIRSDARRARFHVFQGLRVDPAHPGEAYVFAVVLDDLELANFRENLGLRFPGHDLGAEPVEPGLVAQLSETHPLDVLEGRGAGSLVRHDSDPGPRVAIRTRDFDPIGGVADVPLFGPPLPLPPGRRVVAPRDATAPRGADEPPAVAGAQDVPEPASREQVVYLVWVAHAPGAAGLRE